MICGYGVFIPPYSTSDQGSIAALAQVTGLAHSDAQIILSSHMPRRVFTTQSDSEGADRVRSLRAAGFDGFVVSFDAIAKARAPQIHAASFTPDGVVFQPSGGFRPGELGLIVHGEFRSGFDIERTVTTYFSGIGGLPHSPRQESTHDKTSSSEPFVHLYGKTHDQVFELRPQRFNFHCLEKDFALSAAINLKTFIQRLRTLSPNAKYDDTLLKFPPILDDQVVSDHVVGGNPMRLEVVQHKQGNENAAIRASFLLAFSMLRG
jgi:hypothetical protein